MRDWRTKPTARVAIKVKLMMITQAWSVTKKQTTRSCATLGVQPKRKENDMTPRITLIDHGVPYAWKQRAKKTLTIVITEKT